MRVSVQVEKKTADGEDGPRETTLSLYVCVVSMQLCGKTLFIRWWGATGAFYLSNTDFRK